MENQLNNIVFNSLMFYYSEYFNYIDSVDYEYNKKYKEIYERYKKLYKIKNVLWQFYKKIDYIKRPLMINLLKTDENQIKIEYKELFDTNKYLWWLNLIDYFLLFNYYYINEWWLYYKNENDFNSLIWDDNKINVISTNYFDYWNNKKYYEKYMEYLNKYNISQLEMLTENKKKEIKIDIIKWIISKYNCIKKSWIKKEIVTWVNKKIKELNFLSFYKNFINKNLTWKVVNNSIAYAACYLFKKDISKISNYNDLIAYLNNLKRITKDKKIISMIDSIIWEFDLWSLSEIVNNVISQLSNRANLTRIVVRTINNPPKDIFWIRWWKRTDLSKE